MDIRQERNSASVKGSIEKKILKIGTQTEFMQLVEKDPKVFAEEQNKFLELMEKESRSDSFVPQAPQKFTEEPATRELLKRGGNVLVTVDKKSLQKRDVVALKVTIVPVTFQEIFSSPEVRISTNDPQ